MSVLSLEKVVPLIMDSSLLIYYYNNNGNNYVGSLGHIIGLENGLFSYELVVPDFFINELSSHAKNHMNNGKMIYSPMN